MKTAITLGAFLVATACGDNRADPPSPRPSAQPDRASLEAELMSEVDAAEDLYQAGDIVRASARMNTVFARLGLRPIRDRELDAAAHYVRGVCRSENGEYESAVSDLRRSTRLLRDLDDEGNYRWSLEALAMAYDYSGQHAEAEAEFRTLIATARTHGTPTQLGRALLGLGINLGYQGRCPESVPVLQEGLDALAADPSSPRAAAWTALGNCAVEEGRLDDARTAFERDLARRALEGSAEHPSAAVPHHNLGVLLRDLGLRDEAREHAFEAVRLRAALPPDHPGRRGSEALYRQLGGTIPPNGPGQPSGP